MRPWTTASARASTRRVLVVPAAEISAEYYLAFVTDRAQRRAVAVASAAGGVEIEAVARTAPEKIVTAPIDPCLGCPPFQARAIGRRLGFAGPLLDQFAGIAGNLYRLYWAEDADLAEINPLAVVG